MSKLSDNQSKYIALLLRHKPEVGGLTLNEHGWCDTNALVNAVKKEFGKFELKDLEEIVRTDNKQRYGFNEDKTKIRANQGHSVQVDVELKEAGCKVQVSALCPGPVDTEFNERADVVFSLRGISAEKCVKDALKGLDAGKTIIVPSFRMKLAMVFQHIVPTPVLIKMTGHQQKKKLG